MIVTIPDALWSRGKQWVKRLTAVDAAKSDGYAFEGAFAKFGGSAEIEEDAWYLVFGQDVTRSGHVRQQIVVLYRASAATGAVEKAHRWDVGTTPGWALRCRDEIAAVLAGTAPGDTDALRAERENLLARVADIDALLGRP